MGLSWQAELEQARRARAEGNEGRARVCARRAAGAVALDVLRQRGVPLRMASAYEALQALEQLPDLAPSLREAVFWLTQRVDEQFQLPPGVDLIELAERLIEELRHEHSG